MADQDLVTYYRLRAQEYDRVYEKAERQDDIRAIGTWLGAAVAGRRVLELAAGTGYWTPIMAGTAESVVATDINSETLAIAKARDYTHGSAEFLIADAYAPQQVPGDFDCLVAGYFLSHVPRDSVASFLRSVVERAGRGGRVILFDNLFVDDSNLPISRTDADGNTYQSRRLDNGPSFEVLKNFYDGDDLKLLAQSYASRVEVHLLTYYWLLQMDLD